MATGLPRCDICNVRPRDIDKHAATPKHIVSAFYAEQRAEGWVLASGVHACIQGVSTSLLRKGPSGTNTEGGVYEGYYTPIWAYEMARRTDYRVGWRRQRIKEMAEDAEQAQAFIVHLRLNGIVSTFFPNPERSPGHDPFQREDELRQEGRWTLHL